MAGATVTPAPVSGLHTNSGVGGGGTATTGLNASELNAFRISAVIDRLYIHMGSLNRNEVEFLNLCLSLSRGIDFAIANHEIPSRSLELPPLIRLVCQNKNEPLVQAAIMVLMISIKSACQNGWFSDGDTEELSNLAKEIASNFCSVSDFNTEPSCSISVISTVMSRFYPRLRMGHIFVFLEVKPGYEAYVSDFQISKDLKSSPGDKIRLFVVQTDSIETSSCLVTPAKVNFLLNGKGVERRTNLFVDTGPQCPTIVTPLLKYGSNLLQAVGEFNGNFIIAVAFMSEVPHPDSNTLKDYELHAPSNVDADSEVIEGSSRISLNCPISFRRIRTPVKGHLCKHIQCFDFDNYVDINSRRPSWRCPHCNQHVSFSDIRIDQNIVAVLKEVGPNVSDIVISSDGSWEAVKGSEEAVEKPEDKTSKTIQDQPPQPSDVLDLTNIDDMMDVVPTSETQDIKHSSTPQQPQLTQTINVSQSSDTDFWSGILMSTYGIVPTNIGTSLSNSLQLQQSQFGNPPMGNEYGRLPSIPSHITRTPSAVQALPAQSPTLSLLQRGSTNMPSSSIPSGVSAASQALPAALNLTAGRAPPRQVSSFSSSPLVQHSNIQMASMRVSRATNQSPMQSSGNFLRPQSHTGLPQARPTQGPGVASNQHSQVIAAANRAVQMSIDPSGPVPSYPWNTNLSTPPGFSGPTSQPAARADSPDPADMSWRPPGRMRGALSGQAYTEAYNRFMGRPIQPAQASRPISNMTSPPIFIQCITSQSFGNTVPIVRPMGSDILPNGSSGIQ